MRTLTACTVATAIVGLVLAGGCVPQEELQECENANRILRQSRDDLQVQLRETQTERDDLVRQLDGGRGDVEKRDRIIQNYEVSLANLQTRLDDALAKYRELLAGQVPVPPNIQALPPKLDRALKDFAAQNPGLVEYLPERGMVKLKSDLTFEKGSDYVQDEAKTMLQQFVGVLKTAEGEAFNIYIAGHTDDIPIKKIETRERHPDNWYLSVHRAVAVREVMQTAGLAPKRMAAMGFGEYHPIAPNKSNSGGNPLNRRVEIWIVPPGQFLTDQTGAPTLPDDDAGRPGGGEMGL